MRTRESSRAAHPREFAIVEGLLVGADPPRRVRAGRLAVPRLRPSGTACAQAPDQPELPAEERRDIRLDVRGSAAASRRLSRSGQQAAHRALPRRRSLGRRRRGRARRPEASEGEARGRAESFKKGEVGRPHGPAVEAGTGQEDPHQLPARTRDRGNGVGVVRLVGALLLEQNDEWQIQRRYMPLEGLHVLSDNQQACLSAVAQ